MTPWRPWTKPPNVCDTNYTSVAKIAKSYLGRAGAPMEDAHARLRELAGEYRG
jgi:amidase